MNTLYPLYLDLRDEPCLVVGGGEVAFRKSGPLLDGGASVTVVSPDPGSGVAGLEKAGRIRLERRPFRDDDLEGKRLVIAATDDRNVNLAVSRGAARRRILCNVVDDPDLCGFHVPAVVCRGDLKIAVSTGGKGPAFAASVRKQLETIFSERHAKALRVLGDLRAALKRRDDLTVAERKSILTRAVEGSHMRDFLEGKIPELDPEKLSWPSR